MATVVSCAHCHRLQVVLAEAGADIVCKHCGRALQVTGGEPRPARAIVGPRRARPPARPARPDSAAVIGPPPPEGYAPVPVPAVVVEKPALDRPAVRRLPALLVAALVGVIVVVAGPDPAQWQGALLLVALTLLLGVVGGFFGRRELPSAVATCLCAGVLALATFEAAFVLLTALDRARGHEILMSTLCHLPGSACLGLLAAFGAGYTLLVIRVGPRLRRRREAAARAADSAQSATAPPDRQS